MKKLLWLLLWAINSMVLNAQSLYINGKVSDYDKKPVENATIYLLNEKDSSIINYTASNKEGKFSLRTDALKEPSILRINAEKLSPYSKKIEQMSESLSLGDIVLEKINIQYIDEIKISVSPIKIKKDTIEFNASAIKVRPDSKIEELLKQIPGVEISNDGKITANGKEVDQIMINGKPFFDKDGKIALQNLPADIIKNIQFTTTKTKEEELAGKPPKSQNTTINFTIDEKKNKGFLSRITLGYGSDKRYEGSALLSYFKGDSKISILASSNNINSKSVSADEVFDTMGRGRNSGSQNSGGIQKTTTFGLNYNDKLGNDTDLDNLSLKKSRSDTETRSKVSRTTLLPDYSLKTNSENRGENESEEYSFDSSARIRLDSLSNIYISPSFSRSEGLSTARSKSSTFRDAKLLNESESYSRTKEENNTFTPNIFFSKNLSKKGRLISAGINSTISESKSDLISQSQNSFYEASGITYDNRDQQQKNRTQNNNYSFNASYTEPVSDSATVSFQLQYNSKLSSDVRNVNDFDASTGRYSQYNTVLSNSMNQRINQITPELSFFLSKKKFNTWATVNIDISDMKLSSVFKGQQYDLQKNFVLPGYNVYFQYVLSDRKRLTLSNSSSFSIPGANQLIPYKDESDPMITYTGNPDLKNTWTTSSNATFSNFNMIKNFNYYINVGFSYRNNDVINYSRYESSGKQIVTYDNVSGNKNINVSTGFSKTFKWNNNKLTISPRFSMTYNYNNGFINGQLFTSNSYNLNQGINLNYEIKDKFTIKPSYKLGYNFSKYTNYSIDNVNTANQVLKLELTNYLFNSRLVFGNDFEYNTNSNIAPGFKKDFYFWNTSLGYSFLKKQFTAKVKIYDVLNQNQSVRRTISDSYIEDREDLILKRYIMFSLSMKLNRFAGKKK